MRVENITFTSRSHELRFADKIMRNMSSNYPAVVTSRIMTYGSVKQETELRKKAFSMYQKLVNDREKRSGRTPIECIEEIMEQTKNSKSANCFELAYLAGAAFLTNGFNDLKIVKLRLQENFRYNFAKPDEVCSRDIDHAVLLVNSGDKSEPQKHSMIVDPWAGFVDYYSSAISRYFGLFVKGEKKESTLLGEMQQKVLVRELVRLNSTNERLKEFTQSHPELRVNK